MQTKLILLGLLILGAVVLSPAIAMIGLDPMPGDIAVNQGAYHFTVPVAYSLCASLGVGLLYYLIRG